MGSRPLTYALRVDLQVSTFVAAVELLDSIHAFGRSMAQPRHARTHIETITCLIGVTRLRRVGVPLPCEQPRSALGGVRGQERGQLGPVADAELLEDVREMGLDGAAGDEEVLCDRPVAVPACSECGYP